MINIKYASVKKSLFLQQDLINLKKYNGKNCVPYRISNFQERLKKEMNVAQKNNIKIENKCTCSSNKRKTTKGSYNSVTGEVKVEINK